MEEKVIVFYGEDTFYTKSKINQVIKKSDIDEFNVTTYDLDETLLQDAINDAMTIPFMSDGKIVICQNARFLGPEKPKKMLNHNIDYLAAYLKDPSDSTVLIISAPVTKLDERKAIVKQLRNHQVTECKLKSSKDLVSWAKRQVGKNSLTIDDNALDEFIKRVSHSTEFAYLEMRKLLLYTEGTRHIDIEVIKKIITKNIEDNVYEITNALLSKNPQKALRVYHDLILYSEDPLRILNIIITKYREMYHVSSLLEKGKTQNDVQNTFNVSSGRAYYMVQNARSVDTETIKTHLTNLEKLDFNIKTGRIDKKVGLELFILST